MKNILRIMQTWGWTIIYVYTYMYKIQAFIHVISSMNIEMIHEIEKTDTNTGKEKKTAFRCRILNA